MSKRGRSWWLVASPAFLILVIGGGILLYALGRILFVAYLQREPGTVRIAADPVETAVPAGEPFVITVQISNLVDDVQTLHSIDISDDYLVAVSLQESLPDYSRELSIPLVGFQSFLFDRPIRSRGGQQVRLTFVGQSPGTYTGELDVCINSGTLCKLLPITTTITE